MSVDRHPDPLLRALAAPLRGTFFPFGFRLEIETNDSRVLACAEDVFGIFTEQPFPHRSLRMRLLCLPQAAARPPWPAAAYRAWGDLFSVVCGPENFLTADLGGQQAMGYFSPAMLDDGEFFLWTFLECATYMMLQRDYLTPVHAACVVRDGSGILLCGPSGAGKTSLAYFCARKGWHLLSDDAVELLDCGSRLELRGNPARLHFPISARELFHELCDIPVGFRRDGQELLAVPSDMILADRLVTRAPAGAVVFLARADLTRAALEPISAPEAHGLLFDDLPLLSDGPRMAEHSQAIMRLVERGAYRLRYSTLEEGWRRLQTIEFTAENAEHAEKRHI